MGVSDEIRRFCDVHVLADAEHELIPMPTPPQLRCRQRIVTGTLPPDGGAATSTNTTRTGRSVSHPNSNGFASSASASPVPARLLGIADRKGSIEVGFDSDLVGFDAERNVNWTLVGARVVFTRQAAGANLWNAT